VVLASSAILVAVFIKSSQNLAISSLVTVQMEETPLLAFKLL
jgi:hypothetical protein